MTQAVEKSVTWRGLDLIINDKVLVPRKETELLVREALAAPPQWWVHEVGTGCGAVALAIAKERPDLRVTASDIDPDAVEVARRNADRLGLDIDIWEGQGIRRLRIRKEIPELIVANLPYLSDEAMAKRPPEVADEPSIATQGECGPDGLGEIRRLVSEVPVGYRIALEHDTHHGPAVREMLMQARTFLDWDGQERMTTGFVKR